MGSIPNRFKKAAENSAASYGLLLFVSLVLAILTFDSFLHIWKPAIKCSAGKC